ncbi:hypothetical protein H0H93_005341, partial [Arthromyces matolae]
ALIEKADKKPEIYLSNLIQELDAEFLTPVLNVPKWGQHPKLIRLYLQQFAREAPESLDENTIKTALCPIFALYGLCLVHRLLSESALLPNFKQTCESHWPELWKWINPLYRYRLRMQPDPSRNTHKLYIQIDCGVQAMLSLIISPEKGLLPSIAATEGLLGLFFAMYLRFAEMHSLTGFEVILPMLSALIDSGKADANEIRREIGFNKRKGAHALFRPAYLYMQGNLPLWEESLPYVQHILLISTKLPALYKSLSCEVIMTYTCDAMSFILAQHSSPQSPELCAMLILFLANYVFHGTEGHTWLVHGLRKNLLHLLIKGTNLVDLDSNEHTPMAINDLLEIIQANSIHRPIMRNLSNIVDIVNPNDINDPRMRLSWEKLLTTERWVQATHAEFLEYGRLPECSNLKASIIGILVWYIVSILKLQCANEESRKYLRVCSGCNWTRYCSVKCQRQNWKHHRRCCGQYRPGLCSLCRPVEG